LQRRIGASHLIVTTCDAPNSVQPAFGALPALKFHRSRNRRKSRWRVNMATLTVKPLSGIKPDRCRWRKPFGTAELRQPSASLELGQSDERDRRTSASPAASWHLADYCCRSGPGGDGCVVFLTRKEHQTGPLGRCTLGLGVAERGYRGFGPHFAERAKRIGGVWDSTRRRRMHRGLTSTVASAR